MPTADGGAVSSRHDPSRRRHKSSLPRAPQTITGSLARYRRHHQRGGAAAGQWATAVVGPCALRRLHHALDRGVGAGAGRLKLIPRSPSAFRPASVISIHIIGMWRCDPCGHDRPETAFPATVQAQVPDASLRGGPNAGTGIQHSLDSRLAGPDDCNFMILCKCPSASRRFISIAF
jgi:hypothetical protein